MNSVLLTCWLFVWHDTGCLLCELCVFLSRDWNRRLTVYDWNCCRSIMVSCWPGRITWPGDVCAWRRGVAHRSLVCSGCGSAACSDHRQQQVKKVKTFFDVPFVISFRCVVVRFESHSCFKVKFGLSVKIKRIYLFIFNCKLCVWQHLKNGNRNCLLLWLLVIIFLPVQAFLFFLLAKYLVSYWTNVIETQKTITGCKQTTDYLLE